MQQKEINDNIYLVDNFMLKLKYYTLSKEDKYKIKDEFYKTEFGANIKKRLDRLFLTGIFCIIFAILLFIIHTTKWDVVTGIILLLASFIFIMGSYKVRIDKVNSYLVKKKK